MFGAVEAGRTAVKICGVTRPEDAALAVRAGADAVGMIFWSGSRRAVTLEQARAIAARVPPDVALIGVFVNAPAAYINFVANRAGLTAVQLHGNEGPEILPKLARPVLKAARSLEAIPAFEGARLAGMVVDGAPDGVYGGAGLAAGDDLVREAARHHPLILAGGLTDATVGDAIRRYGPKAVDVSSGVESAPGIKDAAKVRAFIAAVGRAGQAGSMAAVA